MIPHIKDVLDGKDVATRNETLITVDVSNKKLDMDIVDCGSDDEMCTMISTPNGRVK